MTELAEYTAARAHHRDLTMRLLWAGPAVNGAGLLAATNIVAGAPSPDAALIALTVPLLGFAVGIWFGGQAVQGAMNAASKRMVQAINWDRCEQLIRRLSAYKTARSEMPISMELARLLHGDDAENRVRDLHAQVLARVNLSEQRDEAEFKTAQDEHAVLSDEIAAMERWTAVWHGLSIEACTLAVLWAIAQPHLGVHLAPDARPSSPNALSTALR